MKKFFELLKVNIFLAMTQLNISRLAKGKKKGRSPAYVLAVAAALIMAYMAWISQTLYRSIGPYGLGWLLLAMGLLVVSLFTLVTGIYSANTVLFEGRDLDQLFSYPIGPLQILFSKLMALVVENWLVGMVFYLPVLAVYAVNVRPAALVYVYALLGFLCAPLIPVCVFILLAYVLTLVTNGSRAKNAVSSVVSIALIVGTTFGMQIMLAGAQTSGLSAGSLLDAWKGAYPPLGYLTSGIANGSPGDLLIGLVWNLVPFIVLCAALSFGYRTLWSRSRAVRKTRRGKLSFGVGSPFSTLLRKEYARYFSSVMYLLNSSIGMILMTLFTVFSGAGGKQLRELEAYFPPDSKILFVLLVFGFVLAVTNTTAPSISLEGKSLWIVKSWPVGEGEILLAKLCVHLTVTIPLLLINCIIAGFTMGLRAADCVLLFVICALFSALGGLTGLIYNLYYHRFDFYSDMQVVKNSSSVLLTTLTMMAVAAVLAGLYWLVHAKLAVDWFLMGAGFVLAVLTAAAASFVFTRGRELFKNLS
jgi:ABC-2 type transport system permease protein